MQDHPPAALPRDALMREDTELRGYLAGVLAFVADEWADIGYEPPPAPGLQADLMREILAALPHAAEDADVAFAEFLANPSLCGDAGSAVLWWLRKTRAAAAFTEGQREVLTAALSDAIEHSADPSQAQSYRQ